MERVRLARSGWRPAKNSNTGRHRFAPVRPKNKSKMAAQDVKNFDGMHKMNRILGWKRLTRSVKLDHTASGAQAAGRNVCKCFNMNDLQNNQRSGQSNPVKVRQTLRQ
jgi:hypothetical protein